MREHCLAMRAWVRFNRVSRTCNTSHSQSELVSICTVVAPCVWLLQSDVLQQKDLGVLSHMVSRCLLRQPSSVMVLLSTSTDYEERSEIEGMWAASGVREGKEGKRGKGGRGGGGEERGGRRGEGWKVGEVKETWSETVGNRANAKKGGGKKETEGGGGKVGLGALQSLPWRSKLHLWYKLSSLDSLYSDKVRLHLYGGSR